MGVLLVLALRRLDTRDLWLDEAYSLAAFHDLPRTVRATGATMSTYYALVTPWSWISESPAWLRLPSLGLMAAAVAVTSSFVARVAGRRAGWWCALVAGATPMLVTYSVEARSYALACLLVASMWMAFDRILADPAPAGRWYGLAVACAGLLPLTHGLAAMQVGLASVAVLASRPARRVVVLTIGCVGLTGVVLAGQLAMGLGDVGSWIGPLNRESATTFVRLVLSRRTYLAWTVAGLAAWGGVRCLRDPGGDPSRRFRRVALILWGPGFMVAVLAVSLVRPFQVPRYGISACLGLAGLVAVAVTRLAGSTSTRSLGVLLVGASAFSVFTPVVDRPWSETRDLVAAQAVPGDQIFFGGQESRIPFEAAWVQNQPTDLLQVIGYGGPLGSFGRFDTLDPTEVVVAEVDPSRRLWVVQSLMRHDQYVRPVRSALVEGGIYVQAGRWQANVNTIVWLYVPATGR